MPKRRRAIGETLGAAIPVTKEVKVKKENQAVETVDVTEPAGMPELGRKVVEAMREVSEAIYSVRSLKNVNFQELVEE